MAHSYDKLVWYILWQVLMTSSYIKGFLLQALVVSSYGKFKEIKKKETYFNTSTNDKFLKHNLRM